LGNLKERDHFEDLGTDGKIILKWIFKRWDLDMDMIALNQERVRWRSLVNAVTNLLVL
jgi:hypothetical protein